MAYKVLIQSSPNHYNALWLPPILRLCRCRCVYICPNVKRVNVYVRVFGLNFVDWHKKRKHFFQHIIAKMKMILSNLVNRCLRIRFCIFYSFFVLYYKTPNFNVYYLTQMSKINLCFVTRNVINTILNMHIINT